MNHYSSEGLQLLQPQKEKLHIPNPFRKVIVISGPTAVGKSELALECAKIIGGEIISADSMQVYRNMNIGTSKPTQEELNEVKHHLIDIKDVTDPITVVDYYREAKEAIRKVLLKDKVPIVVGGSGFYLRTLIYGPPLGPPSDPLLRKKLTAQMEDLGRESLYEYLQMLDPEYAATITENDGQKIIRALEIIHLTRKKVSEFPKPEVKLPPLYNYRCWFLHMPKEKIYEKAEKRCDKMLEKGFIEEVERLLDEGILKNHSAAGSIGYRQAISYLLSSQSKKDWAEFVMEFKKATRNYVKRQFTWFRKEKIFRWLNVFDIGKEKAVEFILQDYEQGN